MKYALLFGSNAFFVDRPVISSTLDGQQTEILRIDDTYRIAGNAHSADALKVSSNITGLNNDSITLAGNSYSHPDYTVTETPNQVHVADNKGNIIIDVLQLLPDALHGLSSHVLNELNNIGEAIVIRFRGDFMIGQHRITVDNEKLFIDDDIYAESVHVGHNGVDFGPNGVTV